MIGANSRRMACHPGWHVILLCFVSIGYLPAVVAAQAQAAAAEPAAAETRKLALPEARAREWEITPSVGVFQSFTSNARLDPPGDEKPDFFTTVIPGVSIHRQSPRLNLDLN